MMTEAINFINLEDDLSDAISSRQNGRWTKEEHRKFVEAVKLYGKNWKRVEEHVATRTGAQIRSHAQKFFNRIEKEHKLDKEEALKKIASDVNSTQSDSSIKKRSFSEFVTNVNKNIDMDDGRECKDFLDVSKRLNYLSKSISGRIRHIKSLSSSDESNYAKLALKKDISKAVISLTKQFVDELNEQKCLSKQTRIEYYKSFLNDLRKQVVVLLNEITVYTEDDVINKENYDSSIQAKASIVDLSKNNIISELNKELVKNISQQNMAEDLNDCNTALGLPRPHSTSEDHILLRYSMQYPRLSDIVKLDSDEEKDKA